MSIKNQIKVKENNALQTVNIEQFADEGFDNVDSKSLALPFLKVLGQLSPQVTQGDSNFIPDAKAGMIYNTVTDELYDGHKGITVIPCYYKLEYIEWKDRDKGAVAPVNVYSSDSDIMTKTTRGDDGKDRLENGNYIEETASHYVMVVEPDKTSTALIIYVPVFAGTTTEDAGLLTLSAITIPSSNFGVEVSGVCLTI